MREKTSRDGRMKGVLDVFSMVAVIATSVVLIWTLTVGRSGPIGPEPVEPVQDVTGLRLDAERIRHVSGTGSAVIVEFSDFQCPFCAAYARNALPAVKRELVESGAARYVTLHFPNELIHPLALQAGEAAECAARQGRFWEMHERLFEYIPALARDDLIRHARALELDIDRFGRCLNDREALKDVRADQAEGRRLGVTGTPQFFIGWMLPDGSIELRTRIRGAVSGEVLAEQISLISES